MNRDKKTKGKNLFMEEKKTEETMAEEKSEFLPLGSIIRINGSVKKLMVLARGVFPRIKGEITYYDYGVCTYPEGIIGDSLIYINHEDIQEVVFPGYRDEDETIMQNNIRIAVRQLKGQLTPPGGAVSPAKNA